MKQERYKATCTGTLHNKMAGQIYNRGRRFYESESCDDDDTFKTFVHLDDAKPDFGKKEYEFYLHNDNRYPQFRIYQYEKGFVAEIYSGGSGCSRLVQYAVEGYKFLLKNYEKFIDRSGKDPERISEEEMAVEGL